MDLNDEEQINQNMAYPQTQEEEREGMDDREDFSELVGLSEEDKQWQFGVEGSVDVPEEEEVDDLVEVTNEDIVNGVDETRPLPDKRRQPPRFVRVRRQLPPTSMGGMRY